MRVCAPIIKMSHTLPHSNKKNWHMISLRIGEVFEKNTLLSLRELPLKSIILNHSSYILKERLIKVKEFGVDPKEGCSL